MEIIKDIHLLQTTKGSYAYLVLGDEPILIDTSFPGRAPAIVAELEKLGMKPTDIAHILLTHHDGDHIGNAHALQQASGAQVWASHEDLPYILKQRSASGFRRVLQTVVRTNLPRVDHTYVWGQKIGKIEVIPTPGHTPGHVSFLYEETLFSGDLVVSSKNKLRPAPALLTWNKTALKRSLSAIKKREFLWVCPAHGEPIQRGNLWETLLD
ncbi:MBL fold metallo-hydrolase [Reticulibacter mediterranei]|uniref:MBL fold metallo-hydrolase n=1 Tax=Reticulibacter mediterranei TaxID=2778369 RepID=A0A8J3J198_9CHLR|nr:MBL fold metallo-hydrolase [Reticulibacter mediterranei]GHP00456.1 MBL fold metallo-hydrolase [Reticulibacter mediterranei]